MYTLYTMRLHQEDGLGRPHHFSRGQLCSPRRDDRADPTQETALNHFRKTMKSRFVEHLQLFITSRGRIVARLVGF
jgi:hypothetical protein